MSDQAFYTVVRKEYGFMRVERVNDITTLCDDYITHEELLELDPTLSYVPHAHNMYVGGDENDLYHINRIVEKLNKSKSVNIVRNIGVVYFGQYSRDVLPQHIIDQALSKTKEKWVRQYGGVVRANNGYSGYDKQELFSMLINILGEVFSSQQTVKVNITSKSNKVVDRTEVVKFYHKYGIKPKVVVEYYNQLKTKPESERQCICYVAVNKFPIDMVIKLYKELIKSWSIK